MDFIKLFLISLIAITSYYLLLQWGPSENPLQTVSSNETIPNDIIIESERLLSPLQAPEAPAPLSPVAASNNQSQVKFFDVQNDVVKLRISGDSGAIKSSLFKKIKKDPQGADPLELFSAVDEKPYYVNSGFFSDDRKLLQPNFYSISRELGENDVEVFTLKGGDDSLSIERTFTLVPGKYSVEIEDTILSRLPYPSTSVTPYVIIERGDFPVEGGGFAYAYLGPVFSTQGERFQKISFSDLLDDPFKKSSSGGWVALIQHYFLSAWVPEQSGSFSYQAKKNLSSNRFSIGYTSKQRSLAQNNQGVSFTNTLYVGPKLTGQLKALHPDLDLVVDYGFLWWLGKPIYWLLNLGFSFFNNWGFAIIFLTIVLKVVLWPLSAAAYRSMGKMRTLGPKLQTLQSQFGDDKQKMGQAMMALYKKEGVNPLGGCLPMLAQMPFFLAFYWVLIETVELRHSPFIFWITDLSAKDPFFVLPILNAAGMYYSQKLTPTPPNADPMQAQMMKYFPLIFALIFAWFPAGLVLYWLVNMLVTLLQQWWYYRKEGGSVFSSET